MVGWLVEYQKIGIGNQHVGQCHALLLSSAQLAHRLFQVAYLQLCQHLLGFQYLLRVALMIKACIQHTLVRVECGTLLQHAHAQVATEDNLALVVTFLTAQDR